MNHVSIPKDPGSSVQLRPLVCFNEGMRSPWEPIAEIERNDTVLDSMLQDMFAHGLGVVRIDPLTMSDTICEHGKRLNAENCLQCSISR